MFHIVLFEPEIPPNTGNIMRLCANTGACLHLLHPLGFQLEDRKLRRAGLDYREWAKVREYDSFLDFVEKNPRLNLHALSTRGACRYDRRRYQSGDGFLFGPETRGLPEDILKIFDSEHRLYVPMLAESRSLNLSNAVSVVLYEAWRQMEFEGALK